MRVPSTPSEFRTAASVAHRRFTSYGRGLLRPEHDLAQPGSPRRSIIIASTERSGSTLLARSLGRTGLAGVPEEYFNPDVIGEAATTLGVPRLPIRSRARRQVRRIRLRHNWVTTWDVLPGTMEPYLEHLLRHRTTANGVFSAKIHWDHVGGLQRAAFPMDAFPRPTTWIHITRRDRLAQAVSLARARQSGQWEATERPRKLLPYEPSFDPEAIIRALVHIDASNAGWEDFFIRNDIHPIRIVYEELVADYAVEMGRLLAALDIDATVDAIPPTERQADEISADWIERFRALTR